MKPLIHQNSMMENEELNEEQKKLVDALELILKSSSESNSHSNEEQQTVLSNFIKTDQQKILQNNDEN